MVNNKLLIISLVLLFIFSLGVVSAAENSTDDVVADENYISNNEITEEPVYDSDVDDESVSDENNENQLSDSDVVINGGSKNETVINSKNLDMYYKDGSKFTAYILNNESEPLVNKPVKFFVCGKTYSANSDNKGAVYLPINLNPGKYEIKISFNGDDDYVNSSSTFWINVKKIPATVKSSNLNIYQDSDIFFTVKLFNKLTNQPLANVKVLFKVYSGKNYKKYYSTTNSKGVAVLNKNLKPGTYVVYTSIDDNKFSLNSPKNVEKSTLKIKPTVEFGCCSVILQINGKNTVVSFRRDSTSAADLFIVKERWWGRDAIKQYKVRNSYFFHTITTADGWVMGAGGADNPTINKNIERLAGQMVSQGYLQMPKLLKIKSYISSLGIGHFVIKTPYGRYAAVWKNTYKLGVLKPGQYLSAPNSVYAYRHGNYKHFDSNPVKASIKIAASDVWGVNRRNIMTYHYKQTTAGDFSISSSVDVYGSNDGGRSVGRYTSYLKDNVKYLNKYYSKNKLPLAPNSIHIGKHNFGKIDKLVKTRAIISCPKVVNNAGKNQFFKVTIKSVSKKPLNNVKMAIKVYTGNKFSKYILKTNKNGIILLNTKNFKIGTHNVVIVPNNNQYLVQGSSKIVIK